jgi:hypothetical protein
MKSVVFVKIDVALPNHDRFAKFFQSKWSIREA